MAEREKKDMSFDFEFDESQFRQARLAVIGVGGGGGNAVHTMYESRIDQITYVVANTDIQVLEKSPVPVKLQLGRRVTSGLGAGGNPNKGKEAAEESIEEIQEIIKDVDMLFITAGMGGGTGTGAAPVIARVARDMGILTVAIVTKPFAFEGDLRMHVAIQGIRMLNEVVNTLIVIPNQKIISIAGKLPFREAFKKADEVVVNAVKGISDLITLAGYVNVDFADVKAIMSNSGFALMGSGMANGETRAIDATRMAIESPLLDDITIEGAKGILVNITGSSNLLLEEIEAASAYVKEAAGKGVELIFGVVEDESLGDNVQVTVIATGFDKSVEEMEMAMPSKKKTIPRLEPKQTSVRPPIDLNNTEIPAVIRKGHQESQSGKTIKQTLSINNVNHEVKVKSTHPSLNLGEAQMHQSPRHPTNPYIGNTHPSYNSHSSIHSNAQNPHSPTHINDMSNIPDDGFDEDGTGGIDPAPVSFRRKLD